MTLRDWAKHLALVLLVTGVVLWGLSPIDSLPKKVLLAAFVFAQVVVVPVVAVVAGRRWRQRRPKIVEDHILILNRALADASTSLAEVQKAIDEQRYLSAKAQKEWKAAQRLAKLEPEDIDALTLAIGAELEAYGARDLHTNVAVGMVFFALGVLVTAWLR